MYTVLKLESAAVSWDVCSNFRVQGSLISSVVPTVSDQLEWKMAL